MVCSRYFRDDELPADLHVVRKKQKEFWGWLYTRFSKDERAIVDARPDFEETTIWFVAHARKEGELTVRRQFLLRNVGERLWGANDVNPAWMRRLAGTPWFATEAEAHRHLTEVLESRDRYL